MDNGQVLGETLYEIIQLMTSTTTDAKYFNFEFIQPGAISTQGSALYLTLV